MTVKETFKTEGGSINATGANSITRTFMVFPYTTFAEADAAMLDLVKVGDTYISNEVEGLAGEVTTFYGTRSWSRVEGQGGVWQFNLQFTTAPSGSTATIQTQGNTRATTKQVWRASHSDEWTTPSNGWDSPEPADIGGIPVDAGGSPTSVVAVDWRFETVELVSNFPFLDALAGLVGKRNLTPYEGGTEGSVLYLGFSWSYDTQNGLWAIRHQFAVDKKSYHAEQVAMCDGNGEVLKLKRYEDAIESYNARHVYWVQPFATAEFNGILPAFIV